MLADSASFFRLLAAKLTECFGFWVNSVHSADHQALDGLASYTPTRPRKFPNRNPRSLKRLTQCRSSAAIDMASFARIAIEVISSAGKNTVIITHYSAIRRDLDQVSCAGVFVSTEGLSSTYIFPSPARHLRSRVLSTRNLHAGMRSLERKHGANNPHIEPHQRREDLNTYRIINKLTSMAL